MTLDRTKPPVIHDAVEFDYKLPPLNTTTLDNGLPLHWVDAGVQDVVQIDWVFPAGLWQEPGGAIAHAVAALLKNGTSSRSAAAINEALEFFGAELKTSASNDHATVTLFSLTKHLPSLLPLVLEILTDSVFPDQEVEIYKRNAVQKLLVNLRKGDFVANRLIDEMLFGADHPYGRCTRKDELEALQPARIQQFFADAYSFSGVRIFMAGKVGPDEVGVLARTFGAMPVQGKGLVNEPLAIYPAQERQKHVVNDEQAVQGSIRLGRLFPNRHHPDFTPMIVVNTLFGGYFGSRLMSNIREDKGYTYGIHSSLIPNFNGGSLVISTETGKDVARLAVDEVFSEMELLKAEVPEEDELLLVKNYLLGGLLADLDGPFSILRRWRAIILNGFDESYFYNSVHTYKRITPEEITEYAKKYFDRDNFYEVIVF
jgi:predicted Zn-dependent peptidase